MAGDTYKKVRPGERLRIPASAYNAFVDAARAHQTGQKNAIRDTPRSTLQAGVVAIRNDSGSAVPRFGVLGVDGSLFQPSDSLEAFQRRIALIGSTPNEAIHVGRFVVTLEPIAAGALGAACAAGLCLVQLIVLQDDGRDRPYAEIINGVTAGLLAGDRGAASILWKEPGVGIKWAVVRLGAYTPRSVFPVTLTVSTTAYGDATTPTAHTYNVADLDGVTLATAINPAASPHQWKRPSIGRYAPATFGHAHWEPNATADAGLVITWVNETPELEACGS
ncbi:MAG: hypothetical protein H6813_02560 [Phycisphaeraceae bacterium]|nr:hypothetical protein [Phycisphaeraceae bacterium]MCB9848802.1 hypothetical protein [Phycisphaeraceae bacterium]